MASGITSLPGLKQPGPPTTGQQGVQAYIDQRIVTKAKPGTTLPLSGWKSGSSGGRSTSPRTMHSGR